MNDARGQLRYAVLLLGFWLFAASITVAYLLFGNRTLLEEFILVGAAWAGGIVSQPMVREVRRAWLAHRHEAGLTPDPPAVDPVPAADPARRNFLVEDGIE